MEAIWTMLTDFITGMFTAIGAILGQVSTGNLITMFLIVIPLFGIAVGYLFKFLGKRRKKRG